MVTNDVKSIVRDGSALTLHRYILCWRATVSLSIVITLYSVL